ncbi:hypothetical protein [Corallococcus caeni]|uniref:hypothetical protein n=1 Tax=Corallococcus caeni TaxID=3082388 RepID=UPI003EBAC0F1
MGRRLAEGARRWHRHCSARGTPRPTGVVHEHEPVAAAVLSCAAGLARDAAGAGGLWHWQHEPVGVLERRVHAAGCARHRRPEHPAGAGLRRAPCHFVQLRSGGRPAGAHLRDAGHDG